MVKKISGQAPRRHPETPPYRCFLSDLTGFAGLRRTGPTRTGEAYPKVGGMSTNTLWYGDQLIIPASGAQDVHAIREVLQVGPGSVSTMLKHEDLPRLWRNRQLV